MSANKKAKTAIKNGRSANKKVETANKIKLQKRPRIIHKLERTSQESRRLIVKWIEK